MSDICNNPRCPHRNKVRAMAFKGAPFCCDECKRAAGADVSSVGTYMFLTTEEAAFIRARRAEAEEHPAVAVTLWDKQVASVNEAIADQITRLNPPEDFGSSVGHPGGHYG